MNDSQAHRGPDDLGMFVATGIGLGHRRLSIIDLGGGHQPMFNEDNTVAVVFNGEIYNYQDLAKELEDRGHSFRTRSDTEVIVHGWEEWGERCVERFRGMFAFAVWDDARQTLFIGRDRLGIKPLYYSVLPDGRLLFSSELKGILASFNITKDIDPFALDEYVAYGYVPDPRTIFCNVFKLPPAHVMVIQRGQTIPPPRAYWDLSFDDKYELGEAAARGELIEGLREAIRLRMIADVPLGAFLSGGVDSSAVVTLMAGLTRDPVEACSITFDDPSFDEIRYARMVGEHVGARHHIDRVTSSAFGLVDRLASVYDEPFADSSALPTYQVCAVARKRVTVALSGDGGDEVFAGYRRHQWHHYEETVRRALPQNVRGAVFGTLGAIYPKMDWGPRPLRAKSTLQALARDSIDGYFDSVSMISRGTRRHLYSEDMHRALGGYDACDVLRHHMQRAPASHYLDKVLYADLKTYLPGDILTKVDRASMAHGLEVRVPLLDHVFVEWAAKLPTSMKLHGGSGKYILKKALEGLVPNDILYRPKMGFSVPLASWFRGLLRDPTRAALNSPYLKNAGFLNTKMLQDLFNQHLTGRRDHSTCLWSVVMLEAFLRNVYSPKTLG